MFWHTPGVMMKRLTASICCLPYLCEETLSKCSNIPEFIERATVAQRSVVTCPQSHSWSIAESASEHRQI